jgi:hypothetical protein
VKSKRLCLAACLLLAAPGAHPARDTSHFLDQFSCTEGPYRLKLPESYEALRKLATLRSERTVKSPPGGEERELRFDGLRLRLVTSPSDESHYRVAAAEFQGRSWRIAGPFRVGVALPAKLGDIDTKELTGSGVVEFNGTRDMVRIRITGRRVTNVTYLCHTG